MSAEPLIPSAKREREKFIETMRVGSVSLSRFASDILFERVPALFEDDREAWVSWKTELAGRIGVDPMSLTLVGSAAMGFSPRDDLHYFNAASDIDVAVVSAHHFDLAWHALRAFRYVPKRFEEFFAEHVNRYLYWGTIACDRQLGCFEFGEAWGKALERMGQRAPTYGRPVSARLYRDPASLRAYQVHGLKETRASLQGSARKQ